MSEQDTLAALDFEVAEVVHCDECACPAVWLIRCTTGGCVSQLLCAHCGGSMLLNYRVLEFAAGGVVICPSCSTSGPLASVRIVSPVR